MERGSLSGVWWVECSVELDEREGKIIIFDTSKGLEGVSISNWYAFMRSLPRCCSIPFLAMFHGKSRECT